MTIQPTFALETDGSITLPDDDGDTAYYLAPEQAVALADFIRDNAREIEQCAQAARTRTAYLTLGQLVAGGLSAPRYVHLDTYAGKLELDLGDDFDTWVTGLGDTVRTDDTHPTLGTRPGASNATFVLQGAWDRKPAETPVPA